MIGFSNIQFVHMFASKLPHFEFIEGSKSCCTSLILCLFYLIFLFWFFPVSLKLTLISSFNQLFQSCPSFISDSFSHIDVLSSLGLNYHQSTLLFRLSCTLIGLQLDEDLTNLSKYWFLSLLEAIILRISSKLVNQLLIVLLYGRVKRIYLHELLDVDLVWLNTQKFNYVDVFLFMFLSQNWLFFLIEIL